MYLASINVESLHDLEVKGQPPAVQKKAYVYALIVEGNLWVSRNHGRSDESRLVDMQGRGKILEPMAI